jgi:hypothetical protein
MRPTPVYDLGQLIPQALQELLEALHYRNLLNQLVRRDILTRYKRSILGVAWLDHGVLKAIGKPDRVIQSYRDTGG